MTDWGKVKFRASSWGNLLTEPREKAAKERGELSVTCQKELVKIYNLVKYGRKKDIVTKQMEKGIVCEDDSITLFSRKEKKLFVKNTEMWENEWATGHPDLYEGERRETATSIHDIKTSWELDSFMIKLVEGVDAEYNAQLNVYYALAGPQATEGSIAYCLVDAPPEMVQDELKRLMFKMNIIWDGDPVYLARAEEIMKNMMFGDISYEERVIKHPVKRDNVLIQKMEDKTPLLRDWLGWFENLHLNGRKTIVAF